MSDQTETQAADQDAPTAAAPHDDPAAPAGPPRDERVKVVTFNQQWGSYFAGEAAAFMPIDAKALIDLGVADDGGDISTGPVEPPPEFHRVAGIDNPPRYWPPNPQHPEIVQTFDPRPLHQMQRAARDQESGHPGQAAREDLESAQKAAVEHQAAVLRGERGKVPQWGAGPLPQPQPGDPPPAQLQPDEYPTPQDPPHQQPVGR